MTIQLNSDQAQACDLFKVWWVHDSRDRPFILHGYAGTGKTTVVEELLATLGLDEDEVALMAPTGKAARVLAKRTGRETTTIHKALYRPRNDSVISGLRRALRDSDDDTRAELSKRLAKEEKARGISFDYEGGVDCKLIVVDEVSMVDERLAEDLMKTGIPLLLIGDPGQLPPVKAKPGFQDHHVDMVLTQIMRQDEGSAILRAAEMVRKGETLPEVVDWGGFQRVPRRSISDEEICEKFDVMLCGTHKVRKAFNRRLRNVMCEVNLAEPWKPVDSERLICRMNDYSYGVFNGQLFRCGGTDGDMDDHRVRVTIEDDGGWERSVASSSLRFKEHYVPNSPVHVVDDAMELDFAYALTVHSAQGSEWDSVVVVNDWTRGGYDRWLYTALTRGAKHVTMIG